MIVGIRYNMRRYYYKYVVMIIFEQYCYTVFSVHAEIEFVSVMSRVSKLLLFNFDVNGKSKTFETCG